MLLRFCTRLCWFVEEHEEDVTISVYLKRNLEPLQIISSSSLRSYHFKVRMDDLSFLIKPLPFLWSIGRDEFSNTTSSYKNRCYWKSFLFIIRYSAWSNKHTLYFRLFLNRFWWPITKKKNHSLINFPNEHDSHGQTH